MEEEDVDPSGVLIPNQQPGPLPLGGGGLGGLEQRLGGAPGHDESGGEKKDGEDGFPDHGAPSFARRLHAFRLSALLL
jgi:hypothetical protein